MYCGDWLKGPTGFTATTRPTGLHQRRHASHPHHPDRMRHPQPGAGSRKPRLQPHLPLVHRGSLTTPRRSSRGRSPADGEHFRVTVLPRCSCQKCYHRLHLRRRYSTTSPDKSTIGYAIFRDWSVFTRTLPMTRLRYHLAFAGTTYQGACFVDVFSSASS